MKRNNYLDHDHALPHKKIVGGELYHFSNLDTSDLSFCLTPASLTGGLVSSLPR